jgi:pantothenate kinase-related protein Tda10
VSSGDAVRRGRVQDGGAIAYDGATSVPPATPSTTSYATVRASRCVADKRLELLATRHQIAADRHLSPILRGIAGGRAVTAAELHLLAETMRDDPIQPAFATADEVVSPHDVALERIELLKAVWGPFSEWWRAYFSGGDDPSVPVTDLWRLYLPFGRWIVREKRRRRPDGLFMIGFNGSPGAGKTVLTNAVGVVVNHLLDSAVEGQAIARSGDDWYLGKSDREPLKNCGYDPGIPGVSNRALPGTHDLGWLRRNLSEMERSTGRTVIRMGNFDKHTDDQPRGAARYFEVCGKVAVFLFDLWFAGAGTDVDPMTMPDGLRRRVAETLLEWRSVFDRMDALWGYNWPSFEQMLQEREAQERLVERRRGTPGMSREDIQAFMAYMIERAWDWRTTSPIPPDPAITFHAWRDRNHRVTAVRAGGPAT